MTDQDMFYAVCEALEKLEIVEGRHEDDFLLLAQARGILAEVKEEMRAQLSF